MCVRELVCATHLIVSASAIASKISSITENTSIKYVVVDLIFHRTHSKLLTTSLRTVVTLILCSYWLQKATAEERYLAYP